MTAFPRRLTLQGVKRTPNPRGRANPRSAKKPASGSAGTRVRGRVSVNPRGFGFLKFEHDNQPESAFIPARQLRSLLRGDRVSATVSRDPKGRYVASRPRLIERELQNIYGTLIAHDDTYALAVDKDIANHPLDVLESSREGDLADDRVEVGAAYIARVEDDGVVLTRQVAPEHAHVERVRARYGIPHDFPPAVIRAARRGRPRRGSFRRDLRSLATLTIDAPTSMDLDDALSVLPADADGGVRVLVSIADVDSIVAEGSVLDQEAEKRATSVYLRGSVTPMLPKKLSEDGLSLLPGKERPTMTAEFRVDPEGQIRSVDLYPSWVRSNRRLSYEKASRYLDNADLGDCPKDIQDAMRWLRVAGARLGAHRATRGGFQIDPREPYFEFDAKTGRPTTVRARRENSAHRLVERLMVAANEAVAAWLHRRGLPAVYRVHDAPDADQVERLGRTVRNFGFEIGTTDRLTPQALAAIEMQFHGTEVEAAMRDTLSQLLGPARYTTLPGPHFGLGSSLYLHFTSPIRRYADLAVHRIIKRHVEGDREQDARTGELSELADHLNERAWAAKKAEQERVRTLSAQVLKNRIGDHFRGSVIAIKPFGLIVHLHGTGVTGVLPTEALGGEWTAQQLALKGPRGRRFEIGDRLDVEISEADDREGRIDLKLAASP